MFNILIYTRGAYMTNKHLP